MAEKKKTTTRKTTAKAKVEKEVKEEIAAKPLAKKEEVNAEIEALKAQIEAMKAELLSRTVTPQVVTISKDTERVQFLWQAPVADDNVILFGMNGMFGRIVGKTGSFYVPKDDLSKILDESVRGWLAKRWLIVVSGLDEDEREALGVNYKEGEYLDKKAFARIAEMGDELLGIYPDLCPAQKEIVAKCLYEAHLSNKPISRELIVKLNKIAPSPAFKAIIEDINEKELQG